MLFFSVLLYGVRSVLSLTRTQYYHNEMTNDVVTPTTDLSNFIQSNDYSLKFGNLIIVM